MYIMSEQVQQHLVPDSKHVMVESPTNRQLTKDEMEIIKIQNNIMNKVIIPILKKEYRKKPPISNKKINQFLKYCLKLSQITYKVNTQQDLAETTIMVYQHGIDKIQQNSVITSQSKQQFIEMTEILMDYTENINSIIIQRFTLFEKAIEQIDLKDLYNSLYGTILSFFCIFYLVDMVELHDQDKFIRITEYGSSLAKGLDGYTDTLDILTSPKELELFRKTEQS